MSSFERDPVLRLLARTQLKLLSATVREIAADLSLAECVELVGAVEEVQRILFGEPAEELPSNVRRLVARGSTGPAFGARGGVEVVVGKGGLRARYEGSLPKRDLIDIAAKYDSRDCSRRTDEEWAAATDEWKQR